MKVLAQADSPASNEAESTDPTVDTVSGTVNPPPVPSETIVAQDSLSEFKDLFLDVWDYGFAGIDLGQLLTAIGIFFIFLVFRQLVSRFLIHRVEALAKRTDNKIDDTLAKALGPPLRFVPVVMGVFFATEYLALFGTAQDVATSLNRSLIVFNLFWGFHRMIEPLSFLLNRVERIFTSAMVSWLIKAIKLVVALVGLATILEIWGIQVAPIIAGLGLFGVAVALGAQDLFKNLIAGILILVEKRFAIGDWIRVDGVVEGTVENIGFRSTFIRRFDLAPVFVPNAQLSDVAVTNFSRMLHRRIYWNISLEYSTSIAQLRQIRDEIETYILSTGNFVPPEKGTMFIRVDKFSDSAIDIMLYCFTNTKNWGEWMVIKEELALAIKGIVEGAGARFAFPSQTLYMGTTDESAPEPFMLPKESKTVVAKQAIDMGPAEDGNAG